MVVDTNILISALGWKGKPRALMELVLEGELKLIISGKQLKELIRVMDYPKFSFTQEEKDRFLTLLLRIAALVETKANLCIIKEDPSDNMLLECAVENGVKLIISGDKHLRRLKKYKGIAIMSVGEFLKEIEYS
ncbi:putative toxin-antitoxin system toxin component, PIN family [Candidatus Woesearchaeota archaeon]|nr:putative toxin-antitoxin system toxin component, PIN family [Candidatus Woesearchaeota archaeon]